MRARIVSTFSLLLVLVAWASAQDFGQIEKSLANMPASKVDAYVKSLKKGSDAEFMEVLERFEDGDLEAEDVRSYAELRSLADGGSKDASAGDVARKIKQSPLYADQGKQSQSTWLSRAIQKLGNRLNGSPNAPSGPNMAGLSLSWLVPVVWTLLGGLVIAFLYFAVHHIQICRTKERKRAAVLAEDEPDRTLDEWLQEADRLAAEGRHREAVRALYLACLLRFDQHRVARFVRGETNWEHFERIQSSPLLPVGLDFRQPTQAFDRIWYGMRVEGAEDVSLFRSWYQDITSRLSEVKA